MKLLLAVLFMFFAQAGKAPSTPLLSHSDDVKAVFRDIPTQWMPSPGIRIWIVDRPTMFNKAIEIGIDPVFATQVAGLYTVDDKQPLITILNSLGHKQFQKVLKHELGHDVFYRKLNGDERITYDYIWNALARLGLNPTEYGASNEPEGFAEAFELYIDRFPGSALENAFLVQVNRRISK